MSYGFPNYNNVDRSRGADPRCSGDRRVSPIGALIHSTDGVNSEAWLLGDSAKAGAPASANYLIRTDGTVVKLCPFERYPYHAGQSDWVYGGKHFGGEALSELLVGIELEYTHEQQPTLDQYQSLAIKLVDLSGQLKWRWPFIILGHYGVARPLGRRTDPHNFDWGQFGAALFQCVSLAGITGLRGH